MWVFIKCYNVIELLLKELVNLNLFLSFNFKFWGVVINKRD